jgi:hypothetical protein
MKSFKTFEIYSLAVMLLCFFMPMISMILFLLFVDGFVPDQRLAPWSKWYGMLAVALIALPLYRKISNDLASTALIRDRISILLQGGGAFFLVFFASYTFTHQGLAYALHKISLPEKIVFIESVQGAGAGHKYCRNRLDLVGNSFGFQRALCGVKAEYIEKSKPGDKIEIYGYKSDWGFQSDAYRYVGS